MRRRVDRKYLGPSTAAIVNAAEARGIPAIRLLDDGNLVQLGYGAAMRRIWTAETDQTSAIAETISRDKDLTKTLLSSCGVPIPEGREVDSARMTPGMPPKTSACRSASSPPMATTGAAFSST
jgi:cyanophycin synthetase